MGYALWIDHDLAWAQGTSEYRAQGVAVVAATDLFRARDFRARRRLPRLPAAAYRGMFASVGALNLYLCAWRAGMKRATVAASGGRVASETAHINNAEIRVIGTTGR
jgi:hypothetical protein